ncbi:MAG: hypothetical protein FWG69_05040, partial [Oscillospiraceae bacterium]|nr:hypothetical protein [Oscillospiraceae bacterium]
MRTFIYKLINLPRRITAVLLAGAIALSGSGMLISTIKETNAEPILDPAKFAPSYGQVSAVYFKDAGINQLGGIALDGFGKVWAWGWNQHGQLGINKGYGINSSAANLQGYAGGMVRIPYFVDNDITVIDVSAGYHFNLALDDEGNVYSWGHNNNQQTGFTVNTTFPSGTGRIEHAKVEGLPKIIKIAANNGYLDENISMALDENNSLWIWGSNTSGEHGQGNITITPSYRATPHKVVFPEEITITEFCAGGWTTGASVNVLDSGGNRWTWGQNISHMLGLGVTTANFTTPQKAVPVSGMGKLVDISSSYQATLALDDNGNLWQWGVIYGTGDTPFSSTVYPVPVQVQTDPAEITRLGYTPVPQSVSAGESTYYFIDQYGRPWTWGSGRYFGFGREGGYENSNKQVTAVAQQYPRVMGDGDTQVFDTDKKTPGDGRIPSFMGNYGFNDMHPTVYDVKYQGKPPEDIWKNFAFQPIPKLNRIFASRSSYMLLDEDGNIYRWGNDGSGSIAWGWDYEPAYDNTGNIYDGLYDKYLYEVILMRGMPYLEPVTFTLGSKANTKIYKGVSPVQTDTVTVDVFLPANFHSPQMNIYFSSTIREIKYVIISADPLNPDF